MQRFTVPQNITSFEFKLIGPLTLKQFGYVATAGVFSFIFFITIGGFVGWLLIIPTAGAGTALALVKISGMTLDKWLVAFFRAITTPPQRVWRKDIKPLGFLDPQFSYYLQRPSGAPVKPASDRSKLKAFLSQVDSAEKQNKLDAFEQTRLSSLDFGAEEIKAGQAVGTGASTDQASMTQEPGKAIQESNKPTEGFENIEKVEK